MSPVPIPNNAPRIRISPRILPRGVVDLLVAVAVGTCQTLVLFGIPAMIVFVLTHSPFASFLTFVAVYIVFLLFSVRYISLGSDGILFHRVWGTPKLLPWGSITGIETVPRNELVLRGWLWPIFPAREMTASLTSLNHYRISWVGGFRYYPPRDAPEFERHALSRIRQSNA